MNRFLAASSVVLRRPEAVILGTMVFLMCGLFVLFGSTAEIGEAVLLTRLYLLVAVPTAVVELLGRQVTQLMSMPQLATAPHVNVAHGLVIVVLILIAIIAAVVGVIIAGGAVGPAGVAVAAAGTLFIGTNQWFDNRSRTPAERTAFSAVSCCVPAGLLWFLLIDDTTAVFFAEFVFGDGVHQSVFFAGLTHQTVAGRCVRP